MNFLDQKSILVTGGTGSFGKVFIKRILSGELGTPRKIIVFSRDEAKQHDMRLSYLHQRSATDEIIYRNFLQLLEFRIGDVRSYHDIVAALQGVDVVINAAALKQVPTCEYFPIQAIQTNCLGPSNIVQAIIEHQLPIHTVVGISTDKACKPINAMGMTKALQERIFISANVMSPKTRFIAVRYGNVMASRGSVIPLFHDQIRSGVELTVTSPQMTRFLLSLDQAVSTVFEALQHANRGEIYVPRVSSANMMDLAKILSQGYNLPIRITGIRPGEKIHEIMVSDEEAPRTHSRGSVLSIKPMLPELEPSGAQSQSEPALQKEYSSADCLLSYEATATLLRDQGLMFEARKTAAPHEEFLR